MSLILVDTSYTSFYRFFATLKWFSMNNTEFYTEKKGDNTYDWSTNEIFIEKYEKMYLKSIIDVVGRNIYNESKVIFCMDTPRKDIWRNEIMENYKADRCDLTTKYNFKPTFDKTFKIIIPKIIKENNNKISKLKLKKLEADDIIAVIAKYYEYTEPDKKIYIISGDKDFLQLGRENLIFIDYKNKKHIILSREEAKNSLKEKIINGDCSDNIRSIFPKNKKKKQELIDNEEKLNEYLNENPLIKQKYELNRKMIDFNYIPTILQKQIIEKYLN